ncbi:universal stress protein [Cryptosporangium minutisporangium]|uniref:universal stress protein n=1 Tax=Cryptosporangium minutisporangium TaxID=113569 RepID=UPI0035E5EC19
MTEARPIVVGVDGSPESRYAIAWAAPEAVRGGYRLRLVHAVSARGQEDGVLAAAKEVACAAAPTVDVETALVTGGPASALLAEGQDAAYLVVGARGETGFAGLLLGSVALQLAQYAPGPVVVARPLEKRTGRLVVGVDASDEAATALRLAGAEADQRGADLVVLHATRDPISPRVRAAIDAAVARVQALAPDAHVEGRVVQTHPAEALIEASADADLVVVGSRGVGGFRGMLLGSVAAAVLHHARSPVAVIRRRPES